jgi:putative ABC transport system permease protein
MLLRLYWMRLRTQPAQEALAMAGIAAGVALIFAVEIANTSVPASVRDLVHGIAGRASLEVASRTPEGFNQSLVNKVGEAPGVFGDAGILNAHVTVVGPRGELALSLFGAEPGITAIGGTLARSFPRRALESAAPAGVQPAALARRLAGAHVETIALPEGPARALGASPGQLLLVRVAGRSVVVLCGGVLTARQLGTAAESPVAISLLSAAQRITGLTNRVTRILVVPQKGREHLARTALAGVVGDTVDVRPSDSEVSLLEGATRYSNQAALVFTALSVVVGLLFAYNAMLLTLPARRRYITRLRNMGAYRYEVGALIGLEVVVLGAVASLAGLALGVLLSRAVFGGVPHYLTSGFPIGNQRVITWPALLVSVGGGMLATAVAALGPAIGALRGQPLERTREATETSLLAGWTSGPLALTGGIAAIIIALALALLVPGSDVIAFLVLAVGLAFVLAPAVPWLIGRAVPLTTHLRNPAAYVATTELRAAPWRATAVAATSAVAVYAIVAIGGASNDIRRGVTKTTEDFFRGTTVVVTSSSWAQMPFPVQPFPPSAAIARLRAISSVDAVDVLRTSFLDVGSRRLYVIAKPASDATPISASQIVEGSASRASTLLRQQGWAALSSTVARAWHLHRGEPFVLPNPSGYTRFRLAATITNYGWPPGALVMSPTDYTRLWGGTGVSAVYVTFRRGVNEREALSRTRQALGTTGLTAALTRQAAADLESSASQGMSQLNEISTLLLAAAVLAVIAAMAGSTWQRRARLASLKRLGMSRGELISAIYLETGVVVVIGCLLGAIFGLGGQPLATEAVREITGFPDAYAPAVLLALRMLALATLLAMVATGLLGYLVTRRPALSASRE